jgi:hypothetical protein
MYGLGGCSVHDSTVPGGHSQPPSPYAFVPAATMTMMARARMIGQVRVR